MSIKGKIKTLFSDKNKTEVLFPRTKVSAVSDDNGVGLNVLLEQTVPMTRGGTGAENGAEGLANMFAAGSTVLSPYQYGTELPANAAVGQVYFEEATGTIADIGQDVAKALRAVNLLDNSDFRNPVNQRGLTIYNSTSYTIDRWQLTNYSASIVPTLEVKSGYITVNPNGDTYARLIQNLENYEQFKGKRCTIAVNIDGEVYSGIFTMGDARVILTDDVEFLSTDSMNVIFDITAVKNLYWAALYEGEYTAETLPPYVPKGYGAELLECQRYYYQTWIRATFNANGIVSCYSIATNSLNSVELPVEMRAIPTIAFYTSGGDIGVKEWASGTIVSSMSVRYQSKKRFTPLATDNSLEAGKTYAFHYSASADL